MTEVPAARVIVGYDGSRSASAAIEVAVSLIPRAHAWIGHLWTPPFASEALRRRLWANAATMNEFIDALEREGAAEANRLAAMGVTLAVAAGWEAEALVERTYGGEGLHLTQLAEKLAPDLVLVGSRGLDGAKAILGSVSDMVVHYASGPVIVVPNSLLTAEREAMADGPVIVGWDGSAGAQAALAAAARLFPTRKLQLVSVDQNPPHTAATGDYEVISLTPEERHATAARTVAGALAAYARRRRAALVVVGSRGRSAVREMLLGSVAVATLHHAYSPVMVVPHPTSSDVS
ncbi:universal stress protein [Actinoplanes sp. GCM10030250]|uniref:universal stress protein n=1 Tax=Actinoplanes sp. GCM10030250 TaxID=3273376 RepID=UPI003619AA3F